MCARSNTACCLAISPFKFELSWNWRFTGRAGHSNELRLNMRTMEQSYHINLHGWENTVCDGLNQWFKHSGFLGAHSEVYNLFNLGRHFITTKNYRMLRSRAFTSWKSVVAIWAIKSVRLFFDKLICQYRLILPKKEFSLVLNFLLQHFYLKKMLFAKS